MHHLSLEMAAKAFEADAAFSAALAKFQSTPLTGNVIEEASNASRLHGFSWFCRPSNPGPWEVVLRHEKGAETCAEGESITALLAGLLGHPLAHDIAVVAAAQAAEPDKICDPCILSPGEQSEPKPKAEPSPAASLMAVMEDVAAGLVGAAPPVPTPAVQVAAESLAAATGGAVAAEPVAEHWDPATPLTAEQRAAAVEGIKALTPQQQNSFKIAFRSTFKVDRTVKSVIPLINELRHLHFCDRFAIEATGGVAA